MTSYQYLPSATTTSGTSSGTSTTSPAPTAANVYQQAMAGAMGIAGTPYEPYQGKQVAGFTPDQLTAQQGYRDLQGYMQPYVNQAMDWTKQGVEAGKAENYFPKIGQYYDVFNQKTSPYTGAANTMSGNMYDLSKMENFNQQALNRYMNPYQQSVVDATLAQMKQNQDVLQNQNTSQAIQQGAYGGSGMFMGQAELGRQQALANAQTLAQLNASNYNQAMQQYNQQQGVGMQGAQQAYANQMGLGQFMFGQQQAANQQYNQQQQQAIDAYFKGAGLSLESGKTGEQGKLSELGALNQSGAQQQALQQANLDKAYQQWQQAKAYPYQQVSFLSGIAGGLGPNMGSTTNTSSQYSGTEFGMKPYQNQSTNTVGQIAGLATGLAGAFMKSDGGRVGYASGGPTGNDLAGGPYGNQGFGPLMSASPYNPEDDYISSAAQLMKVIPSAKEVMSGKAIAALTKAMGEAKPKFGNLGGGGDEGGSSGSEDDGVSSALGNLAKLGKSAYSKYGSDISSGLGSLFSADGGRVGFDEGGVASAAISPEQQRINDDYINNLYKNVLHRNPDAAGAEFWKSHFSKGFSPEQLSQAFYSSPEYASTFAKSSSPKSSVNSSQEQANAKFLLDLYKNKLGRNAEQGGFEYWADKLKSGWTPEQVSSFFQSSPERMNDVRESYADLLGRTGEDAGLQYWMDRSRKGMSLEDMKNDMRQSPEYKARIAAGGREGTFTPQGVAGLGFGGLDPIAQAMERDRLINPSAAPKTYYETMLDRAKARNPGPQLTPEQQGLPGMPGENYYKSQLPTYNYYTQQEQPDWATTSGGGASGSGSNTAITTSTGTPESNTAFLNSLYNRAFMRKPDPEGLAFWQNQMAQGMTPEMVRHQFDVSQEHLDTAPVQGYYIKSLSRDVNPETGDYNVEYSRPYYGRPTPANLHTGGRVKRAVGGRTLSKEDIARAALQAGATPQEAAILTSIAMPESSGNPYAHNQKGRDNSYGLWQINMLGRMGPERVRQFGLKSYNDLFDPVTNAKAALDLLRSKRGAKHWSTYLSGAYKPYYSTAANVVNTLLKDPNAVNTAIVMPERPAVMASDHPQRKGFFSRLINAFSPISSAQAAEGSVLNRINPSDPSGPLLPEGTEKPILRRGAAEKYIMGHERPRTAEELGLTKQPDGSFSFTRQPEWYSKSMNAPKDRMMLPETPEKVSSADFPGTAAPMGTGFDEQVIGSTPTEEATATQQGSPEAAKSSRKYWGDYRDVENSDFGDFIDMLAGDVRTADKPGTAETPMGKYQGQGLGALFDLEGTLPYGASNKKNKEEEGFNLGGLFNIFG